MTDGRLPSALFIAAHIRRCEALGLSAFLRHRGAAESGGILLRIDDLKGGVRLLELTMAVTGERAWMQHGGDMPLSETGAEEKISRRLRHDPDLWVLEIEDPKGAHMLDEPVI